MIKRQRNQSGKGISRDLLAVAIVALLVGLGLRVWSNHMSTYWGFFGDHFDHIGVGVTAQQNGLLKVYSVPISENPVTCGTIYSWSSGQSRYLERQVPRVVNYPPLAVAIFYVQTVGLRTIDPSMEANTFLARLWMASVPIAMELLLVVGMYLLVRELANPRAGIIAAIVCWLFPPIWLNASYWGQVDSWVLAPSVFAVWLMLRNRWLWAGIAIGVGIMLKPQGIILAPVVLFAAAIVPAVGESSRIREFLLRLGKTALACIAVIGVISLPWWVADGYAWLRESYLNNFVFSHSSMTTAKAFNLWYLDALLGDKQPPDSYGGLDSLVRIGGLTKAAWGKILLLTSGIVATVLCWRKYRHRPGLAVVLFATMWLLGMFVWPTEMRERFFVYSVPLLIAGAMCLERLWLVVLLMACVGTAEMTWPNWLEIPAGSYSADRVRANYARLIQQDRSSARRGSLPGMEELQRTSWYRYQNLRRSERPKEWLATVSLLLAYGLLVVLPFVRVHGDAKGESSAESNRSAKNSPRRKNRHSGRRRK